MSLPWNPQPTPHPRAIPATPTSPSLPSFIQSSGLDPPPDTQCIPLHPLLSLLPPLPIQTSYHPYHPLIIVTRLPLTVATHSPRPPPTTTPLPILRFHSHLPVPTIHTTTLRKPPPLPPPAHLLAIFAVQSLVAHTTANATVIYTRVKAAMNALHVTNLSVAQMRSRGTWNAAVPAQVSTRKTQTSMNANAIATRGKGGRNVTALLPTVPVLGIITLILILVIARFTVPSHLILLYCTHPG